MRGHGRVSLCVAGMYLGMYLVHPEPGKFRAVDFLGSLITWSLILAYILA